MKQNKRFILLVVMVLLANCLFAGLASAASYNPAVNAISVPAYATFSYNRQQMDPSFNLYATANKKITLTLSASYWIDRQPAFSDSGRTITGTYQYADGVLEGWHLGWNYVLETGNSLAAAVGENCYFRFPTMPLVFELTSSDSSVVSVPATMTASAKYDVTDATVVTFTDYSLVGTYQGLNLYALDQLTASASATLTAGKAGTATITIKAYTKEDIQLNRGYATGDTVASFPITIKADGAGKIVLSKKATSTAKKVGDSVTAALAPTNVTESYLWTNIESIYGNNDILAFVYNTNLSYVPDYNVQYASVPTEWKIFDATKDTATKWDFTDSVTGVKYTPSKYKQVSLSEYTYAGLVQYRFTDLEWSASPAGAAEITTDGNKATIKFLKDGDVTITASLKGDSSIKASVKYTVAKNPDIPTEDTQKLVNEAGKTSMTVKLTKGVAPATFTLKAKDGKTEIVKYVSSKTSVATIDEKTGVVTIVKDKEGTVQFTGYDKSGNAYTFNLKVKKVPVSKLTVAKKSLTLKVGENAKIEVTTKPAYAYNPAVKYTSGDKKIATVDVDGYVWAKKAGTTTVTVTPKFAKDTVNPVVVKVKVK